MTKCEKLQAVLDEAMAEGDGLLIEAIEAAMRVAGCTSEGASTDSGGGGHGDPDGG